MPLNGPRLRGRRRVRRRVNVRRAPATGNGRGRQTAPTRSTCWSAKRRTGSPSSCPCATAGCSSPRSPSIGAPRRSWPPTSRKRRALGFGCRRAATHTYRTSEGMRHRTAAWSLTLTIRRDPPRPVGVGRQAAGRQLRDRGPGPRVRGCAATKGRAFRGPGSPREHAPARRAQQSRGLVPARRRRSDPRSVRARGQQGGATKVRPQRRQGTAQGPDAGVVEADRTGRRRAPIRSDPPVLVPLEQMFSGKAARDG